MYLKLPGWETVMLGEVTPYDATRDSPKRQKHRGILSSFLLIPKCHQFDTFDTCRSDTSNSLFDLVTQNYWNKTVICDYSV